jgi:hypothetical protein
MSASLVAIRSLHDRGYITKEAAVALLEQHEVLVTEAVANLMKTAGPLGRFGKAMSAARAGISGQPGSELGWPEMLARVVKVVGLGAGIAGGMSAVHGGIQAVGSHRAKKEVEKSRAIVLKNLSGPNVTPDVRRAHEIVFDTVAEYAPSVASNPAVAQGIVGAMATPQTLVKGMPQGLDQNFIRGLAETQYRVDEAGKARSALHPFMETHSRFLSGPMSGKLID